ncbi:hypothetical protein EsH8_V_000952 [Colletotrichum jinshuiense]
MASRYPMPNIYTRPAKEKKDGSDSSASASTSASAAIKSFFTAPSSYPVVSASTSRYPLPTVYATSQGMTGSSEAKGARSGGLAQGSTADPRSSVGSWDTIDEFKDQQARCG